MYNPADLRPAELQVKRFFHLMEKMRDMGHPFGDLVPVLFSCPLFLYTSQKSDRALAWYKDNRDLAFWRKNRNHLLLPALMVDPTSAVWVWWREGKYIGYVSREVRSHPDPVIRANLGDLFLSTLTGVLDYVSPDQVAVQAEGFFYQIAKESQYTLVHVPCVGDERATDFKNQMETALIQLDYACQPRHVVVEETPPTVIRNPGTKHIPRASERTRIIVLDPEEAIHLRRSASPPQGGHHASPVTHHRRKHLRTLKAAKWTNKRGQTVEVRDTIVRPGAEWNVGRTTYKVVDLSRKTEP